MCYEFDTQELRTTVYTALDIVEFFLNAFTEFIEKIVVKNILLEPATSCLRDQEVITQPIRHR